MYVDNIKRMGIKEFQEMGLLAEVNRTFFHPLGLALEVTLDGETGELKLGGIWDYRDDPEGMLFGVKNFPAEKCKKAQKFIEEKHKQRQSVLGYVFQDIDNPQ